MKIIIIGQGNVAVNYHHAFCAKHVDCQLHSSREGLDCLPEADCYIYAVRDEALETVINRVHAPARVLHAHTSGTMPLSVFGADKPHAGILYPLQSLSRERILEDFSKVPILIQGRDIDDVSALYTMALSITQHIFEVSQHDRERLHLCGVLVNNFPNLLYRLAQEVVQDTHLPFNILLPLIDETAAKVHTLSPKEAQTGPAKRGDKNVMEHHMSLIKDERLKEIYLLLSKTIYEKN